MMVANLDDKFVPNVAGAQLFEIFSGQARTARLASWSGYKSKAFDYKYSRSMDLLHPSGFTFLNCF